jgi:DUF4097 and DUF4098 domain-containing protein YvlB
MRALRPHTVSLVAIAAVLFAIQSQAADGRFDQTLPVTKPFKPDILNDAGEISLRAGSSNKIEIHAKLHSIDAEDDDVAARIRAIELSPPISSDIKGHNIRIGHFANSDAVRNISISYEIVVPSDTQLHSETGTGDQSIEGIQGPVEASSGTGKLRLWHIGRDVHARTGSGDIDLHDVHSNVLAKAGTGAVYATDIRSDQVASHEPGQVQIMDAKTRVPITVQMTMGAVGLQIVTGSGDVDVENLEGGLNVTSGSGNIRASGKPSSDWELDTGTGTVRTQFPDDANLALVAHTSSGAIDCIDTVKVQGNKNPHELHGQIGKGGPTVDLKTATGNIEIR